LTVSSELGEPYPWQAQGYECVNSFEWFSLKKRGPVTTLLIQDYQGICFLILSYPGTQNSLQPLSKCCCSLFHLSADVGVVCMMLVLQACKMQE
jgi:hypothetical protein